MKRFFYELSEDREQYLQYEMNQRLIFQYCMLTRDVFIKYEKPLTFHCNQNTENTRIMGKETNTLMQQIVLWNVYIFLRNLI